MLFFSSLQNIVFSLLSNLSHSQSQDSGHF
jgi:hypothetical protein